MVLTFECKTNKNYVMINTLKIKLKNGSVLTVDRKETEWSYNEETGELSMDWNDCYIWAIDGYNIFGDEGMLITGEEATCEFASMIDGAKYEFELEDDADEDYSVNITKMYVS